MKHLVLKAQKKDDTAFVRLMEMNKQSMYKVAKSYLRSDEDAADAIQETILTCYEKLQDLREPGYFKTWMIRILINKCKDLLRKNQELGLLGEIPEKIDPGTAQQNAEFMDVLDGLDEKYRTILILYYVEGFNTREISELLDVKAQTVRTRLVRARQSFAQEYQKEMVYAGR